MPKSAFHRVSVIALVAGSLAAAAACGGNSAHHTGTPRPTGTTTGTGAGTGHSAQPTHGTAGPVYNATVPTVSNGTDRVLIDHTAVTFPSTVTDAAWSPDGARLVYVDGGGNIATARPDGTAVRVLTQTKPGVKRAQPAFEDGGGEIVFSERGADGVWRLMAVGADGQDDPSAGGSGEALLDSIGDGVGDTAPSAAYDPAVIKLLQPLSVLAYQHQGSNGAEIWILDRNQRGPQGTKARDGAQPAVSPDGKRLAFVGGDGQLYIEALPILGGATAVRVTAGVAGLTHPVWSPNGNRIAFGTASNVESVSTAAPAGSGGNPLTVESPAPGVASYEPMRPTSVLRFATGDPVSDAIAESGAFYQTVPSTGVPPTPIGATYATAVTLVSTADPKALTVASLGWRYGPVLFTQPDSLASATSAELTRLLGPARNQYSRTPVVNIIGDTSVISAAVEARIKSFGYQTTRRPDADPIAAAVAVNSSGMIPSPYGAPVYVVSASDAPAILSLEALGHGASILLTDNAAMPAADQPIINRIETGGNRRQIIAVGGQAQAALASSWPGKPSQMRVTPFGGSDADLNSLLIAQRYSDGPTEVGLASTNSWQEALLAAANGPRMPVVFVDPRAGLSADAAGWLADASASVGTVVAYGDTASVPQQVTAAAENALQGPAGADSVLNPQVLLHL
jgi:WD40 repeat protein